MDLGGSPKMEGQKVTSRKYYEMELQKLNASLLEMGEMIRMAIGGAVTALLEFDHDKAREIIVYDEQIDRQNREIEQQCYTLLQESTGSGEQTAERRFRRVGCGRAIDGQSEQNTARLRQADFAQKRLPCFG